MNKIEFKEKPPITNFEICKLPAIHELVEKEMVAEIKSKIHNKCLITTLDIGLLAEKYYYSPRNLSLKSAIINSIWNKKAYKDEYGNITQEVLSEADTYLEIATDSPHELIRKFNIKKFGVNPTWIGRFMDRSRLCLRKSHNQRRGSINPNDVQLFFDQLEQAIIDFGPKRVFNMDETFVRLRNFSPFVIAEKGQDEVKVLYNYDVNEKIGTTFIATISMDPNERIPIGCIAKGTTKRCKEKFGIKSEEDGICFHSKKGWTNETIMKEYLDWLHKRYGNDIALVLDVFSAHKQKEVKDHAEKLKIRLIFVPACGTGLFQPLDRAVFGIVKKKVNKMSRLDPMEDASNAELYRASFLHMKEAMEEVSNEAIKKAWDMPRINQYIEENMECVEDKDYVENE